MPTPYIAPHKDRCGSPDPNYDRQQHTFALLEEALGNIGDAWWCLYHAMKASVYFEPDEDDIKKIEESVKALEKRLEPIVRRYCP